MAISTNLLEVVSRGDGDEKNMGFLVGSGTLHFASFLIVFTLV